MTFVLFGGVPLFGGMSVVWWGFRCFVGVPLPDLFCFVFHFDFLIIGVFCLCIHLFCSCPGLVILLSG